MRKSFGNLLACFWNNWCLMYRCSASVLWLSSWCHVLFSLFLFPQGRYLFLNAIANQLRYPNSHTHYFSCTMLYLFAEANTEAIQEQITRWDWVWSDLLSECLGGRIIVLHLMTAILLTEMFMFFSPLCRVLLERLIVNRPHPWGLLITFIELIKNPAFKFWSHDFVHCAPEIEKYVPWMLLNFYLWYFVYVKH